MADLLLVLVLGVVVVALFVDLAVLATWLYRHLERWRQDTMTDKNGPTAVQGDGAQDESSSQHPGSRSELEQRQAKSVHPAADLLPPLSKDEYGGLVASIRERGLLADIEVWSGPSPDYVGPPPEHLDKILNGIHRQFACFQAGVQPRYVDVFTPDPVGYVLARNIHRHLDSRRKRQLIETVLRSDVTKSDRQIAELIGVSHPTVANVREELERAGEIPAVAVTVGADGIAQRRWKNLPPNEKGEPPAGEEASHDETPGDETPGDETPGDEPEVKEPDGAAEPQLTSKSQTTQMKSKSLVCVLRSWFWRLKRNFCQTNTRHTKNLQQTSRRECGL